MTAPTLLLLAALAPAEGMTGAACTGLAPLFDAELDGETSADRTARHERATDVCEGCRVLNLCRASLDTLAPDTTGIWAGVVLTGRGHR